MSNRRGMQENFQTGTNYQQLRVSLGARMAKNLPAMHKTLVQFLIWDDPLEKAMATHSSFLAWRIPWTEEPGGLQSMGSPSAVEPKPDKSSYTVEQIEIEKYKNGQATALPSIWVESGLVPPSKNHKKTQTIPVAYQWDFFNGKTFMKINTMKRKISSHPLLGSAYAFMIFSPLTSHCLWNPIHSLRPSSTYLHKIVEIHVMCLVSIQMRPTLV